MRHRVAGRKLGRRTSHKEAMLCNLVSSLYKRGRIITTIAKAKEATPLADHYITVARRGDLASRRYILRFLSEKDIVNKLFNVIAAYNPKRNSGYTRIIRLGFRKGDGAETAIWELMDRPKEEKSKKEKGKEKNKEKAEVKEKIEPIKEK